MRSLRNEQGLTLPEIILAMFVLMVGLMGVAGALVVSNSHSGVAGGISGGQAAIERGNAMSTAIMLAQERMEQVKRLQYRVGGTDAIGSTPGPPAGFADEGFNAITGYPNYQREVRVLDATPAANSKTVSVTVTVRFAGARASEGALSTERITLRTIIAARP